jgi:hypothetical protein
MFGGAAGLTRRKIKLSQVVGIGEGNPAPVIDLGKSSPVVERIS